jgi:hypothetical protein
LPIQVYPNDWLVDFFQQKIPLQVVGVSVFVVITIANRTFNWAFQFLAPP